MNLDTTLCSEFRVKLDSYDFNGIFEKHEELDKEIECGIKTICCDEIRKNGARYQNGLLILPDKTYISIESNFDSIDRTLTVHFVPSNDAKVLSYINEYYLFGTLKAVVIKADNRLKHILPSTFQRIRDYLEFTYTLFEKTYISKFNKWNPQRKKILLDGIYELIETQIQRSNNPKLIGKVWLSIIQLDDESGDTGKFIFEFNDTFLEEFIGRLKSAKDLRHSPFVLVSQLIHKIVNDEQTAKYKEQKYVFQVDLDELDIREHQETKIFWKASQQLYTDDYVVGMGCDTLIKVDKFLISVDHSAPNQELVLKIIEPIKEDIEQIFMNNIDVYKDSRVSRLNFKTPAQLPSKIVMLAMKIREVFFEKSIEQAIWEPVKQNIWEPVAHFATHLF